MMKYFIALISRILMDSYRGFSLASSNELGLQAGSVFPGLI